MLDECASGYTYREGKHNYHVRWRDRIFVRLSTGEHGRSDPEIQIGHVRGLVRQLAIEWECAKRHIPLIGKGPSQAEGAEPPPSTKEPPPQQKKGGSRKR
jgi:hypothetical protein